MKIFNIASKQSGMLLWKQGCHGNDDWRVTEETTVAMETASQWAIFEASEKKHAPSLIIVYVCRKKKKLRGSSLHVCLASIMRMTVGWSLRLHVAVYALK